MNPVIEQQNFPDPQTESTVFSSDGTKEQPPQANYSGGVEVRYTAPAKWWNWLWNKITQWLLDSKADKTAIKSEMLNTLSVAGITPSVSDTHQTSRAIDRHTYNSCSAYNNEEVTEEIDGVMVTHRVNQPYVVGFTLYIPDTELL